MLAWLVSLAKAGGQRKIDLAAHQILKIRVDESQEFFQLRIPPRTVRIIAVTYMRLMPAKRPHAICNRRVAV